MYFTPHILIVRLILYFTSSTKQVLEFHGRGVKHKMIIVLVQLIVTGLAVWFDQNFSDSYTYTYFK